MLYSTEQLPLTIHGCGCTLGGLNFLDAFISEDEDSVVAIDATDPDGAVLGLEAERQLTDEILVDAGPWRPGRLDNPQGGDGPNYPNL